MKFIELIGIDEKPILINPEQIVSVYESSWAEETTNSYRDPINGGRHSYPIKTRHECTKIVCVNSYSVIKSLLEEKG